MSFTMTFLPEFAITEKKLGFTCNVQRIHRLPLLRIRCLQNACKDLVHRSYTPQFRSVPPSRASCRSKKQPSTNWDASLFKTNTAFS